MPCIAEETLNNDQILRLRCLGMATDYGRNGGSSESVRVTADKWVRYVRDGVITDAVPTPVAPLVADPADR